MKQVASIAMILLQAPQIALMTLVNKEKKTIIKMQLRKFCACFIFYNVY